MFPENWHFNSRFVLKTTKTPVFIFITEILWRTFWHNNWRSILWSCKKTPLRYSKVLTLRSFSDRARSHLSPVLSSGQKHVKVLSCSSQVPPPLQGLGRHGLVSPWKKRDTLWINLYFHEFSKYFHFRFESFGAQKKGIGQAWTCLTLKKKDKLWINLYFHEFSEFSKGQLTYSLKVRARAKQNRWTWMLRNIIL